MVRYPILPPIELIAQPNSSSGLDASDNGFKQYQQTLKASRAGKTYNTRPKQEIVRKANVALRPYDQHKYANKLGSPAK